MRIGELAEASATTTKTLRFYEEAGLLPAPERTSSGYRDYAPEALARLDFIRRSRTAGLTLAQIRDVLDIRDAGVPPCQHVQDLLEARLGDLDRQIADLQNRLLVLAKEKTEQLYLDTIPSKLPDVRKSVRVKAAS